MQYGVPSQSKIKSQRGFSSHVVPVQRRRSTTLVYKLPKSRFWQRIISVTAGSITVALMIQVTLQMFESAYGVERLDHTYTLDDSVTMREWMGTSTVRQSPLVESALRGRTDPLNFTLYLGQDGLNSFQQCEQLDTRQKEIYSDRWQRSLFAKAVAGTAHNFTFLNDIELIAPVVDCGSSLTTNDSTRGKLYFLARAKADFQDVYLLTLSMAIQEFWIPSETQVGSAAIASLTLINDLQSDYVDHHFIASLGYPFYSLDFTACEVLDNGESQHILQLQTISRNWSRELSHLFHTSYRSGFYRTSETGRYNIRQQTWVLEDSPLNAITTWRWRSKNTSRNMWSWVHLFEPILAVYCSGHIVITYLIVYQALNDGILWSIEGCVAIAKPIMFRGVLAVTFWSLTSFWDLTEFCLRDAHEIVGANQIFSFTESMRYDFIFVVANWGTLVAHATKERIDPGLGFVSTLLVFSYRIKIVELSPSLVKSIKELTLEFDQRELRTSSLSPMQSRAPYAIDNFPRTLMMYVLTPHLIPFLVYALSAAARKTHKSFRPNKMLAIQQSYTQSQKTQSFGEDQSLVKSAFTNFELATGSQLEAMYGLLSDFENIVIVKGMRFASADGVFGAGFVMVNKKFLVQVNDIWHILLMKLIRVRYINVYIFLLTDTTVQPTALVVYPNTITMRDLVHLSVTTLS